MNNFMINILGLRELVRAAMLSPYSTQPISTCTKFEYCNIFIHA